MGRPNAAKSRQDASETAWGALKMAPTWPPELSRRPRDPPRRLLYTSRTAPGPPKTPSGPPPARPRRPQVAPRASKTAQGASKTPPRALQERFWRPQAASKSSPEEALETPSRVQELSPGAVQACSCCPAPSSLWPASGLGGMREALTIRRTPSGVLRRVKSVSQTTYSGLTGAKNAPPPLARATGCRRFHPRSMQVPCSLHAR